MADMAIDEVNKIRMSLGMKPLPAPGGGPSFKKRDESEASSDDEEEAGSTLESRQAQGYDNWKKLQDEKNAKAMHEAKAEAVKKARDTAQKSSLLEGKGLGEADETGDLDAKTWIQQSKKRRKQKEKERLKLERELVERENGLLEHTSADLAGVKVAHEVEDFDGEGDQILTLKDTTIEENEEEGDELENVNLREKEALDERLKVRKKKPVYDPHALENEGGSAILEQYDEAIDGKKRKRFTLDGRGASLEERQAIKDAVGEKIKRQAINLDLIKDVPVSDYNEVSEPKIKKPKKGKSKSKRQRQMDDDDAVLVGKTAHTDLHAADEMDVDDRPVPTNPSYSFVDDEDLQASLAIQRRAALKKRKKTSPEDIARQLKDEESVKPDAETNGEGGSPDDGLIIDETTEFVANLERSREEERARPENMSGGNTPNVKMEFNDDEDDVDMERSYNDEGGEQDANLKREVSLPKQDVADAGIEEEATLDHGIGATLNLLSQRGLVQRNTEQDLNSLQRERQRFLTEKQHREADIERRARSQRERDRASGKLDHMSAREREEYARYENKQRDQIESRIMTDIFNREYKPDVQLKYVDEFGRNMSQKEAFKHLSHQFHGKGSGKQKTEKQLKKIEDEKKRESQSILDSSEAKGMNNAMGATAKKNRQAGVRLG